MDSGFAGKCPRPGMTAKRLLNFLLATSALVVIANAHPARAADQTPVPRLPTKTAILPPAPIYNWTGCYIGAQGGGGAVSDPFVGSGLPLNLNFQHGGNAFAGGQIGCNYQNGMMVLGLEAEAWSGLTNPARIGEGPTFKIDVFDRNRWSGDVALRAGLAFDRALVYGKAGIAEGRFAFSASNINGFFEDGASTLTGVLLGVGLEYGLAPNWSAKLEYDHIEYAGRTVHFDQDPADGGPFDQPESASVNLIKAGINYRFGGSSLPLPDGAVTHTGIFKAPVSKAPAAAVFSWTGCYAGVHGGGGWMFDSFIGGGLDGGGGIAGGQLGCNVQAGPIVWGVESEAAWSGLTDHPHSDDSQSSSDRTTRNRWSADVAARAGVAVDRALVYGKAGLAAGKFEFSFTETGPTLTQNGSATLAGLLFGAGVEYAVAPHWSVKLEYNHIDYFGRNVGFDDPVAGHFLQSEAATANVIKLGVNYQFSDVPFAPAMDRAATTPAIFKAQVYKAPVYKAPAAASYWTGCYLGIHGGGGILGDTFTEAGSSDTFPVPESSGGFAGGQVGCDVQAGALVVGLEGEAARSHIINRSEFSIPSIADSSEISPDLVWSAGASARAGIAIDRGLVYGKAGVAAGGFRFFNIFPGGFEAGSTTLTGLLLGGGIEYALAPNWSVLLEYDRIAYGGRLVHFDNIGVVPFDKTQSAAVNELKAGINYRFGGAALPPARGGPQNLLPPPATDWTGCYAGIHAGGGIIDDAFVPPTFVAAGPASGGSAIAGAQAGCNVQTGIMVFGLEGEAAWSNLTNRFTFSQPAEMEQASNRNAWSADLAARGGIAFDRALLYGKAGVAAGRFVFSEANSLNIFGVLQGSTTLTGLLLGTGIEYAFAPNWSAKLEYDHTGYLSRHVDLGIITSNQSATTNTVKAGINYKFYGPLGFFSSSGVVVARD